MRRIEQEKMVIAQMVRLYCQRFEGNAELCAECTRLLEYARGRLDACRFGDGKPTCRKCQVHCYKPEMKERVRNVMRWAGPRMLLYHPASAIRHMLREHCRAYRFLRRSRVELN